MFSDPPLNIVGIEKKNGSVAYAGGGEAPASGLYAALPDGAYRVGFRATPYSAVYAATKHALVGLSHALRGELSGTGVKVCAVYPGTTRTEFRGSAPPADGPFVHRAEQVARAIVRTARWPRRDVILAPYRLAHLVEPVLGGPLDHLLGEARRRALDSPGDRPPSGS